MTPTLCPKFVGLSCPTCEGVNVEIITLEAAEELLDQNDHGREPEEATVKKYVGLILNGEWSFKADEKIV